MEELKEKKETKHNKRFAIAGVFAVFLMMSLVYAAYSVLTTSTTVKVDEAFENWYVVVDSSTACTASGLSWAGLNSNSTIDLGTLYPGEEKKVCVRIRNHSSADLHYAIVTTNHNPAQLTLTVTGDNGTAQGNGELTYASVTAKVNDDAVPTTTGYSFDLSVTRG